MQRDTERLALPLRGATADLRARRLGTAAMLDTPTRHHMESLTASGAGVQIQPGALRHPAFTEELRRLLEEFRFVVLRGALSSVSDAVDLMGRFGPVNQADTRKDGAVVVDDAEPDEVFRSNNPLPLHKDGLLTGFDVLLVGIYCIDFAEVTGGRTYVSDANKALAHMPAAELQTLRTHGVEAQAVDQTGYYREELGTSWHRFPAFASLPGRAPSLSLGLPHAPGEPESWRVRVADVGPEESDRILRSLREALFGSEFTYYHDWQEGDLLVMDNYAVLHGREGFQARKRRLANIQTLSA